MHNEDYPGKPGTPPKPSFWGAPRPVQIAVVVFCVCWIAGLIDLMATTTPPR
jgi:hypothetical protein